MRRFIEISCLCLVLSACGTTGGLDRLGALVPERLAALSPVGGQAEVDVATREEFDQAVALLRSGHTSRAEELFERMTETKPELAGPHLNIALISLADDRLDRASAAAAKAIECNPASAPAYNTLGIVLRRQGQLLKSERAYQKAVALDEAYALAWRNLGILYDLYLQKPHEALSAYRQFQTLVAEPDKEVAMWISDLTRRFGETPRAAQVQRQ